MRTRALALVVVAAASLAGSARAGSLVAATWRQNLSGVAITVTGHDTAYPGGDAFGDFVLDAGSGSCTDTLTTHVQQTIRCPTGLGGEGFSFGSRVSVSLTLPSFSLSQFTTGGAIDVHTLATVAGGALSIYGGRSENPVMGGVPGMVTVKVAAHAAKGVNASLLTAAPTTLVKVPLSIGKAGQVTGYFYLQNAVHYLTVGFYAWTPGTKTFTGLTKDGVPLTDVVAMGSWGPLNYGIPSLPPASWPPSTVTLVAPSRITVEGPLAQQRTASFSSLTLSFSNEAPEPSTLLLLGTGALGLLRMRTRRR